MSWIISKRPHLLNMLAHWGYQNIQSAIHRHDHRPQSNLPSWQPQNCPVNNHVHCSKYLLKITSSRNWFWHKWHHNYLTWVSASPALYPPDVPYLGCGGTSPAFIHTLPRWHQHISVVQRRRVFKHAPQGGQKATDAIRGCSLRSQYNQEFSQAKEYSSSHSLILL